MNSPHPDNTKLTHLGKGVQLSHALFDVDFLHKPKIIAFVSRFGHAGVTFLFETICQCSRATGAAIDRDTVAGYCSMFRIEKWEEMLVYCTEKEILLETPLKTITNERVINDQAKLALKREGDLARQRKSRHSEVVTRDTPVTDTLHTRDKVRDSTVTPVTVTDTVLDLKKEECGPPPPKPPDPEPPEVGMKRIGKFCRISEIDLQQYRATKGDGILKRCFEKANAWVEEAHATPEFHERKRRAENCSALFANWVFRAVEDEFARSDRAKGASTQQLPKPEPPKNKQIVKTKVEDRNGKPVVVRQVIRQVEAQAK